MDIISWFCTFILVFESESANIGKKKPSQLAFCFSVSKSWRLCWWFLKLHFWENGWLQVVGSSCCSDSSIAQNSVYSSFRHNQGLVLWNIGLFIYHVASETVHYCSISFSQISKLHCDINFGWIFFGRIPWFQYPIIYDIRARPRKISSPTGSKGWWDVQNIFHCCVLQVTCSMFLLYSTDYGFFLQCFNLAMHWRCWIDLF